MEQFCSRCDKPDSTLLRIVLIGEMIQADDTSLYAMAEGLQRLGLINLFAEEDVPEVVQRPHKTRRRPPLLLVK